MSFLSLFDQKAESPAAMPRTNAPNAETSKEELRMQELSRLTQQLREQQEIFNQRQQESQKRSNMAYEVQISTMKQAMLMEQKNSMQLRKRVAELQQQIEQLERRNNDLPVGLSERVDCEEQLLEGKLSFLEQQLQNERMQQGVLRQQIARLKDQLAASQASQPSQTARSPCPRDLQAHMDLQQSAGSSQQRLYHELRILRAECKLQREQLEQMQQLGFEAPGAAAAKIPLTMNPESLLTQLWERLADLNDDVSRPLEAAGLPRALKWAQKMVLEVDDILGRALAGEFADWRVGVMEAMQACEQFFVALGGRRD